VACICGALCSAMSVLLEFVLLRTSRQIRQDSESACSEN
jgi:hypothetical protein